jgi:hypothetical protein
MKEMFNRGLLTGLIGGIGADLFYIFLDFQPATASGMATGVLFGLAGGVLLGLLMMLLLAFLRWVDQRKGWQLAPRLEASEPGPIGFLAGLLATFPGAGLGGFGFGYATWQFTVALYHNIPDHYAFVVSFFFCLLVMPFAVLIGLSVGALAGATLGTGTVGLIRGMLSKPGKVGKVEPSEPVLNPPPALLEAGPPGSTEPPPAPE